MANELRGATSSAETCYALILNSAGQFWNGSTFETYSPSNYTDYDVAMLEVGSSGIYLGNFPTLITTGGTYEYFVKRRAGATPAEDDAIAGSGSIDWTGTTVVSAGAGSMTGAEWLAYVLRGGFKRTDKDTEVFEETTDAIKEMRRRFMFDEAETEITSTDTITVLGDFKITIESDMGMLLGVTLQDGTNAHRLKQLSKTLFDSHYSDINVTNDRGYPEHYSVYGGNIYIGPIPDSVAYSYRLSYSTKGGTIVSGTTAVPFTNLFRDVLRDNVLSRLYKLMDDFEKSAEYRRSFEQGFLHATRQERHNSGVGNFNVTPFGM